MFMEGNKLRRIQLMAGTLITNARAVPCHALARAVDSPELRRSVGLATDSDMRTASSIAYQH